MADKKISALTSASTPLAGTEVLPIVQGGATVKVAVSDLTAGRPVSVSALSATGQISTTVQGASFNAGVNTGTSSSSYTNYKGTNAAGTSTSWIVGINPYAVDGSGEFVDLATGFGLHLARNTGNASLDGNLKVGTGAAVGGATAGAGGIAFPATAVAVADANTLDDYEEGTWTPTQGAGLTVVGAFSSSGRYTKIGRMIYISGRLSGATSIATTAGTVMMSNLPFTISEITAVGTITNGGIDVIGGVGAFTSGSNIAYSATTIAATLSIDFSLVYSV